MRKRLRIVLLAALAAAVVVPLGFALSIESARRATTTSAGIEPVGKIVVAPSQSLTTGGPLVALPDVPEGAKLFGIGTALFALAAMMRRGSRDHR